MFLEILEHVALAKDRLSVKQYFEKCGKLPNFGIARPEVYAVEIPLL